MGKPARNLRWGVEQRLEFIEFRLFWEGGINRSPSQYTAARDTFPHRPCRSR